MKKYLIQTYGCQMNDHDSEKIAWILDGMGYEVTENREEADFIIFNTCAVRKSAEEKVFGQLGELKDLKRRNPNLVLSVCGCMMQREDIREVVLKKYRQVDIIFGTNNIHKLPQLITRHNETGKTIVDINEENREIEENIDANRTYSFKAYVNIMYGCNNFCTYCIVPYTRGRERSREPESIVSEIRDLAKNGCMEVTLLGQNVNSYGKTLERDYSFADLLKEINDIEGLERIRFMTSHPKDISDELIECFGTLDKLCNHLHLPIQSGSDNVLKTMNRKYTKKDYLTIIEKIKNRVSDIALSTDLIVGFPGETDEDFEETLDVVKQVKYDLAYSFLYSIREGTKAASMENQVDDKVKHNRFNKLQETLNPIALENNEKLLGQVVEVLVEDVSKNNDQVLNGRTTSFKLVHFPGGKELIGKLVNVRIDYVKTFTLEGTLV